MIFSVEWNSFHCMMTMKMNFFVWASITSDWTEICHFFSLMVKTIETIQSFDDGCCYVKTAFGFLFFIENKHHWNGSNNRTVLIVSTQPDSAKIVMKKNRSETWIVQSECWLITECYLRWLSIDWILFSILPSRINFENSLKATFSVPLWSTKLFP